MSDMLQVFVKKEMEKQIRNNYPHMKQPAGLYAKVVQAKEENGVSVCTLRILDQMFQENNDFPEIPNVKTSIQVSVNDIMVVLLLYGGSSVFILGRHEL